MIVDAEPKTGQTMSPLTETGVAGEIFVVDEADRPPRPPKFRLLTFWETVAYFEEKDGTLRHGKYGSVPDNLSVQIVDAKLILFKKDRDGRDLPPEEAAVEHRGADIIFSRDGLFACAEKEGFITISRSKADDWELFRLVPEASSDLPPLDSLSERGMPHSGRKAPRPIKLFWWQHNSGINLGDAISPLIVSAVSGRDVVFAPFEKAELLAAGSILGDTARDWESPVYVWGTGLMSFQSVNTKQYVYSAVRGPLTSSCVSRLGDLPMGDPGILTSCIWKASNAKKYRWGIIPHHTQQEMPIFQKMRDNTTKSIIIDITNTDIEETLYLISSCDFIASTSLHGLVIADSYKIPNIWLKTQSIHKGGGFKFFDYFLSVGRPNYRQIEISNSTDLTVFENKLQSTTYLENIAESQELLYRSFPGALR